MSKIFEWVKKDKCKALIIGIGGLIFIVGMAIVVANSGGTYAVGGGYFKCPSTGYCSYFDEIPSSSTCSDGWQLVSSCSSSSGSSGTTTSVTATFYSDGSVVSTRGCTYNDNQGETSCTISDLPIVNKDGYTFNGWGTSASCTSGYTTSITLSKDTTYYACWTGNIGSDTTVGATFVSEGKTIAVRSCTYNDNQGEVNCTITDAPTPTRSDYIFNGWGKMASCTSGVTNITISQDTTYYACWLPGHCYKCLSDSSKYVWAASKPDNSYEGCGAGYEEITSITSESNCKTTTYKVTFNRAEGTELFATCETDASGKISTSCVSTKCSKWSTQDLTTHNPQGGTIISNSEFSTYVFTANTNLYCLAGTSSGGEGSSDPDPDTPVTPTNACYVCDSDPNIMKWSTNGDKDSNCASYTVSDKSKSDCDPIVPEDPDTPVIPTNACYVCRNNANIFKWSDNDKSDIICTSGYDKTNKSKEECTVVIPDVPEENIKTGDVLVVIAWVVGIGALGYSVYYFRSRKVDK